MKEINQGIAKKDMSKNIKFKKGDISLIVYDFDGVMTDNRVLLSEDGKEAVFVNRSDGLAVKMIKEKIGIQQIIITTESNAIVKFRAEKLKIPIINSVEDKKKVLQEYLSTKKIKRKKVIFVGNDINDKSAMEFVGFPIATADAHGAIKRIAKIVLSSKGGQGAVREILDFF